MNDKTELKMHPLYPVLMAAIEQAMYGKGERHGGAATPFLEQPMFHYIKMHGRGFATGQAAKKLEEAASTRQGKAFEQEVLGAIVYAACAILAEQAKEAGEKKVPGQLPLTRDEKIRGYRDKSLYHPVSDESTAGPRWERVDG